MDSILQLGEISDRLYWVNSGRVGIFVNTTDQFCKATDNQEEGDHSEEKQNEDDTIKEGGISLLSLAAA